MTEKEKTFKITILGSGTCVPSLKRSSCSVMMETGEETLVFDFGAGTMNRLLQAGKHMADITYIFLSHFLHADHSAEIVPFLFAVKHYEKIKRPQGIAIVGGPGFVDFYSRLQAAYGDWMTPCDGFLKLVELSPDQDRITDFGDFSLAIAKTFHKPESIAFRVMDKKGAAAVYSGDTGYCEDLINLSKHADLLITESAFPDEFSPERHMTPSQAGRIAQKAGVKKLVLTHFYPECEKVDIAKQAGRTYDDSLILAEDLMEIRI